MIDLKSNTETVEQKLAVLEGKLKVLEDVVSILALEIRRIQTVPTTSFNLAGDH